eukprot:1159286-Pelagomonas_calceolata.AAC.8
MRPSLPLLPSIRYDDDLDVDEPADAPDEEDGVKVLTDSNFADTIAKNKYVLVGAWREWVAHWLAAGLTTSL